MAGPPGVGGWDGGPARESVCLMRDSILSMGWIAAAFMGLVLGLLGGGGGILTVPILVGFFGMSPTEATGASLLVVGSVALLGSIQGMRAGEADLRIAVTFALPAMAGAILARAVLLPSVPKQVLGIAKDDLLLAAFALLMVVVGVNLLRGRRECQTRVAPMAVVMGTGAAIGLISGALGAGGGFLIVPALSLVLGVDIRRAIPTSLVVIAMQSLGGFLPELRNPVQWAVLGPVILIALVGMLIGNLVRHRVPAAALRYSFAAMLALVAAWMLTKAVTHHLQIPHPV